MWDSAEGTSAARSVRLSTDGPKQSNNNKTSATTASPIQTTTTCNAEFQSRSTSSGYNRKILLLNFPDSVWTSCAHLSIPWISTHTSCQDAYLCVSHAQTYDAHHVCSERPLTFIVCSFTTPTGFTTQKASGSQTPSTRVSSGPSAPQWGRSETRAPAAPAG